MSIKSTLFAAAMLGIAGVAGQAQAVTLTEDFEAPFPTWESGWFGVNSNARNFYCDGALGCATRGNNPDGLWVISSAGEPAGSPVTVTFNPVFGSQITSFSLDVAGHLNTTLTAYDINNVLIFDQPVTLTGGSLSDPGIYASYTITLNNGISRFSFSGGAAGNTSIDNLVVETALVAIPEPSTLALLGVALFGFAIPRRVGRRRRLLRG